MCHVLNIGAMVPCRMSCITITTLYDFALVVFRFELNYAYAVIVVDYL